MDLHIWFWIDEDRSQCIRDSDVGLIKNIHWTLLIWPRFSYCCHTWSGFFSSLWRKYQFSLQFKIAITQGPMDFFKMTPTDMQYLWGFDGIVMMPSCTNSLLIFYHYSHCFMHTLSLSSVYSQIFFIFYQFVLFFTCHSILRYTFLLISSLNFISITIFYIYITFPSLIVYFSPRTISQMTKCLWQSLDGIRLMSDTCCFLSFTSFWHFQ